MEDTLNDRDELEIVVEGNIYGKQKKIIKTNIYQFLISRLCKINNCLSINPCNLKINLCYHIQ